MTGFRLIYDDGEARLVIERALDKLHDLTPVMVAVAGVIETDYGFDEPGESRS